jgi:hypothetical protein
MRIMYHNTRKGICQSGVKQSLNIAYIKDIEVIKIINIIEAAIFDK